MYRVVLTKSAHKHFLNIDKRYTARITEALLSLEQDPYAGKQLKGKLHGIYSLRVWPYRILYTIEQKKLIVFVLDIAHRQGVYQ
jgi:mRNA interferase RelE/StbE